MTCILSHSTWVASGRARPESPVSRFLMDQAEQLVAVGQADFRKFNTRALLCKHIPNPCSWLE